MRDKSNNDQMSFPPERVGNSKDKDITFDDITNNYGDVIFYLSRRITQIGRRTGKKRKKRSSHQCQRVAREIAVEEESSYKPETIIEIENEPELAKKELNITKLKEEWIFLMGQPQQSNQTQKAAKKIKGEWIPTGE